MKCTVSPLGSLKEYRYVVILSRYEGKILLSRHKQRTTWETQGGHIEPGETPEEAAKRELFEESGAAEFELRPLFDYRAEDEISGANGVVFLGDIRSLGPMPESEMACVGLFDALPENLTYPGISPVLFEHAQALFAQKEVKAF